MQVLVHAIYIVLIRMSGTRTSGCCHSVVDKYMQDREANSAQPEIMGARWEGGMCLCLLPGGHSMSNRPIP